MDKYSLNLDHLEVDSFSTTEPVQPVAGDTLVEAGSLFIWISDPSRWGQCLPRTSAEPA